MDNNLVESVIGLTTVGTMNWLSMAAVQVPDANHDGVISKREAKPTP